MKGFGSHLQLSVFQCDLTPRDLVDMTYTLGGLIDQKSDQVLIMDLGPSEGRPIKSIQYVGKPMTVVQRGAMIV
jgi:CRISPR-associated protein Cas2